MPGYYDMYSGITYDDFESYCNRQVAKLGIMPPSLNDYKSIDDMVIKNYTHTDENGNPVYCKIIDDNVFYLIVEYLYAKHPHFKAIKKQMDIEEKAKQEYDDSDKKAQQRAEEKERREKEEERQRLRKIEKEKEFIKSGRELKKKLEKELLEDNKEYFDIEPTAEIRYCELCRDEDDVRKYYRNPLIYPRDFINEETNKPFTTKLYEKGKYIRDVACCAACYDDEILRQEERKRGTQHYCLSCDKNYFVYGSIGQVNEHMQSQKHKDNHKIRIKFLPQKEGKKYLNRLEWLKQKQLHQICSNSKDDKGYCLIPSYSKYKRYDLIIKMYEVYDQLTIDDTLFA